MLNVTPFVEDYTPPPDVQASRSPPNSIYEVSGGTFLYGTFVPITTGHLPIDFHQEMK
jgi:hypothetical protein